MHLSNLKSIPIYHLLIHSFDVVSDLLYIAAVHDWTVAYLL